VLAFTALFVLAADPSQAAQAAQTSQAAWVEVSRTAALTVYRRTHSDGVLTEWMASGSIAAPPYVVKNALDDYTPKVGQMPYMAETKVLKRDANGTVIYNRTAPPLVDDRDYTIRMFDDSYVRKDGAVVYVARWRTANDEGPPPRDDVVRVDKTEGYWRLDPIDDGKRTKATYFVVASPGGNIPQSIADMGTNSVMADIFTALRARAKVKSYAETKPPPPTKQE
jgi:hypothetical protein